MAELRAALEGIGLQNVRTYIQSGNVVINAPKAMARAATLETRIEAALEARFGFPIATDVRADADMRAVVADAPEGFGVSPSTHLCDVVFLKPDLTVSQAMDVVTTREGVDRAWPGSGVVYFERLAERRTESRLSRIMGTPAYGSMTIRNWNTTTRLVAMLDDR
jgi:uncharacterized protein (DUF1697 family)